MKIETYIKNETKKYEQKAIRIKNKKVDLDKLETLSRQHERNCIEYIEKQGIYNYSEECKYKDMARNAMEEIDEKLFGCFNNKGQCLGFNFYGSKDIQYNY